MVPIIASMNEYQGISHMRDFVGGLGRKNQSFIFKQEPVHMLLNTYELPLKYLNN